MKSFFWQTILIFALIFASSADSLAQPMTMGNNDLSLETGDDHTAREEAEGKEIWEKFQAKEVSCQNLSDEDFAALGEYFMGQMMGDSHQAMNARLTQMLGEKGEEQMHVAMGKRMSGCQPNAPMPQTMMNSDMMPMMMQMMMGGNMMTAPFGQFFAGSYGTAQQGFAGQGGGGNSMMGNFTAGPMGWFGFGIGWIFMILFWGLVILGIVALIKWLANQGKSQPEGKSALDILKERYAKGEIDKKEFEEKKKDLE